jgi:hypothetical protein
MVKVAPFGYFIRKSQFFPVENNTFLHISILTKWVGFVEPPLVQNKQGSRPAWASVLPQVYRCVRRAIKIHFGGI